MELSATRHWSVLRHIARKHSGLGEPISINTRQTRTQMNIRSRPSSSTPTRNLIQFNPRAFNSSLETGIGRQLESPTQKNDTISEDILKKARQITEIQTILKQNQSASGPYPKIEGPTIPLPAQPLAMSPDKLNLLFILVNILQNYKNVGFKGRICFKCFSCWIDPVCNNREDGMKSLLFEKPPSHECDAERALVVSKYSLYELEDEKEQALRDLTESLFSLVSYIAVLAIMSRMALNLNVEDLNAASQRSTPLSRTSSGSELPSREQEVMTNLGDVERTTEIGEREQEKKAHQPAPDIGGDCIDLGRMNSITDIDWEYRAINGHGKRSIVVNGAELLDFVATARATFRAFRVRTEDDDSYRYFLIYFSFR